MLSAASQIFLLMRWRSLRTFLQADFHASMKSACRKVRVNCEGQLKWNPVYGIPARAASRISDKFQIAALRIQEVLLPVHPRHSQKRIFDALRCFAALFAHEMALPSYLSASRFSCEHEICSQKGTSELGGTN